MMSLDDSVEPGSVTSSVGPGNAPLPNTVGTLCMINTNDGRVDSSPRGARIHREQLETEPYSVLAELCEHEPVSWIPAVGGWYVTNRELAIAAMRDAESFTVDDPRFTTAAVLGPSMLSLDGPEHARHRAAFADHFRPATVRTKFEASLRATAEELLDDLEQAGRDGTGLAKGEFRTGLAGPLAVRTIIDFLGLVNVDPTVVLQWYEAIAAAIVALTVGEEISPDSRAAIDELHAEVSRSLRGDAPSLIRQLKTEAVLTSEEIVPAVAVVMFGAIETSEGMTANALWHLMQHPMQWAEVVANPSLISAAVEESLRLEPAAGYVDRYTTHDVELGGVTIPAGDLVSISLLAANRDPAHFERPHEFDLHRANARQHVTFVQGPHGCLGLHLARLETVAALEAVVRRMPDLTIVADESVAPRGLIFRKPPVLTGQWTLSD